jgi:hypothetical protein
VTVMVLACWFGLVYYMLSPRSPPRPARLGWFIICLALVLLVVLHDWAGLLYA